ncbi:hypothetical protein ACTQX3_02800 [Catenibacterium mitsuokai]|uniref:hypothetical protein n=1 Tax=Catenibacterium mitsuokai TaxID=100886 RepID=UPI003F92395F
MNVRRSFYNIFFGMLSQIISIALGIIIPRLVLVSLGSESNGLLSSVNQALVYLSLLEAGIGTATLQALYKPVAEEDKSSINQIMAATNIYYKRVGLYYFIATLSLAIIYPIVVKSGLSYFTIFSVILLSGLSQVINFFFQGKYRILMQVEGKNYILTNLGTIINVFTSISKIILLLLGCDIIVLQLMYFIFSLLQMIYIMKYIKKNYKWLDLSVTPNYDAISQKNSVLIHQISGLIFQNTDVLILTVACGLKVVSVYSMYVMLFGMIGTTISTINSGVSFAMGQAYNTDKKKFNILYNAFETYNMSLTFSLYCVATIFIIPFLKLYTAGVTDINYFDKLLPYLFVATYLLSNGRSAAQRVIEYAGHFKLTQDRSIIESAINVVVSLVGVVKFGIYGVLLGTIAALLYRTNDMILYSSKRLLKRSPSKTYLKWGTNLVLYITFIIIFNKILLKITLDNYLILILSAGLVSIIVIFVFFAVGSLIDNESFKYCLSYVRKYLKKVIYK